MILRQWQVSLRHLQASSTWVKDTSMNTDGDFLDLTFSVAP